MSPDLKFDALFETWAEKIAEKVVARLSKSDAATPRQKLFSVERAAEYIGRSEDAVRHMIASGKLPVVRIDTRISLDKEDLDRLIHQSKQNDY